MNENIVDFVGGCLGGITGTIAGHPFDTVKVRLQMQKHGQNIYRGVFHAALKIIKYESVSGLFKGMASPLAAQALINGIIFGVYSESYRCLQHVPYTVFWAGCVSGLAQSVVAGPVELAKICLQVQGEGIDPKKMTMAQKQKLRYTGSIDCLWKIFRTEGFKGISKGMCVTIVRETPASGVYFYTYDELCKLGPKSNTRDEASPVTVLTAGGIAGVMSWIVTYPTDVIKSRFQADLKGKYRSSIDCAIKSYQAEGWRMFFQGMNSSIIRAFPTNAVTFGTVVLFSRLVYGDDERNLW